MTVLFVMSKLNPGIIGDPELKAIWLAPCLAGGF
jgi:hypothetical protein